MFFTALVVFSFGFSKELQLEVKKQNIVRVNGEDHIINDIPIHNNPNETREQITLILEDFEGEVDWDASASDGQGWTLNTDEYNSETTSYNASDYFPMDVFGDSLYKSWDLFSPLLTLPELGDGETMHFDFFINLDMPGAECDGDGYLDDYYGVSILDIESLAWHTSDFNSYDDSSWFCGFEDIGNGNPGYLDAWVQYLDTPTFTVPAGGTLSADMFWAIESPAGASVAGSCTDGWDQANVQISVDGGNTFSMLQTPDAPYDFGCGYGMVYNGFDCTTNGGLGGPGSGDCPGWGGESDGWNNLSFDLSDYEGQDAIVRFAFYADPGYSTLDDSSITGFQVDNVVVSDGVFSDTGDDESNMDISGAVWVDQFYDYYDAGDANYDPRPGSNGWEVYNAGLPFNGNVFMDISDFAGKDVIFRFQTRMGEMTGLCGEGDGMFIDDFRIYKESGGSYPTPAGLMVESGDSELHISWDDMNASGTEDFDYTNADPQGGIQMATPGSTAWAGERIDLVGPSTINTISVHLGANDPGVITRVGVFGLLGSLYNNEPLYTQEITLNEGWNTVDVGLDMSNGYIVAMEFTNVTDDLGNISTEGGVFGPIDETAVPSTNSMILFSGGGWDLWSVAGATVGDGEWGVKANISFSGANATYSVYRDGNPEGVASGLSMPDYTDMGLTNNQEYYYQVTATYPDGTESDYSEVVYGTPFSNTVVEQSNDDGTAESFINAGSGKTLAAKFSACSSGEQIIRFKWYQEEDAGAFYIKLHADDGGMPGDELFSRVVAGGLVAGWNEYDLSSDGLDVSGDFWMAIREFSSTRGIGLDTSSADTGNSMSNADGSFEPVAGNLMIRALLDTANCGEEPDCTAGDTNSDGGVDVLDVVAMVGHIIGNSELQGTALCAADFNGDGGVDVLDVVAVVQVIINP